MEINDLKRKALALRESVVEVGPADAPRRITLRRPTRFEARLVAVQSGVDADQAMSRVRMERYLVEASVVAWDGVVIEDLLPGGGVEPVPYHKDAVPLLLDANQEWADKITVALFNAMVSEDRSVEASTKN